MTKAYIDKTFENICGDFLDSKIKRSVLEFQAKVDQGETEIVSDDDPASRTTVSALAFAIHNASKVIMSNDLLYVKTLDSLKKIEDPISAKKHIEMQINNNIVKYICRFLAKLDRKGKINLSHADIEPTGLTLDVYLLPMRPIPSEIHLAYDKLLENMFKPLKYQKDDETEVIVMYGSRDLFTLHQKDVDSTITIRTNEHLNGTEIVSVDNEMSWEKHETAENEYFVKALNCLMPLQVEK